MGVVLGPAGIPLSCKGRTIVEGLEDIIGLGLETMEVQTVRMISPGHFEQYWQAGVLANKAEFQMNIHGPYYAEILGERVERNRTLMKMDATLQGDQDRERPPRDLPCGALRIHGPWACRQRAGRHSHVRRGRPHP